MAQFVWLLFLLFSSATACDRCVHQSKVDFFSSDAPLSTGACGYGPLASDLGDGNLAAAVAPLYKDGAACGACFKIRCKDPKMCSTTGTNVTLFDLNRNSQTDLVISSKAFKALANQGMEQDLMKLGIVNMEYKRVPCQYKDPNLFVRVEDSSNPNYLSIKLMYQGGQTEVTSIDVSQVGTPNWSSLSRNYGAVWDTSKVPKGALQFRFVVTAGLDGKSYWAKNVLPADWKPGQIYDSGIQITDIALENCSPCDDGSW